MMSEQPEQQQMTPEQALAYLEGQIGADSPTNAHHGPKRVYVLAQIAFTVLREAISQKPKESDDGI